MTVCRFVRSFVLLRRVVVLLLCVGCVSTPPVADLPPVPPDDDAGETQIAHKLEPYRLQIGDVIAIRMMLNPELNDETMIQPDGFISTSVVQDVEAYGHTTKELQKELIDVYKTQLKNPHLTVMVRSFAPNRVYVLGEVNNAGEFISVGPNLTLLQAISRGGGEKNSANPDIAVILRRGAGDKPKAYVANYKAAVTGADPDSDVRLKPYDIVYVPRSDVADVFLYFQQYLQQFVPDSFGMSYQLNNTAILLISTQVREHSGRILERRFLVEG